MNFLYVDTSSQPIGHESQCLICNQLGFQQSVINRIHYQPSQQFYLSPLSPPIQDIDTSGIDLLVRAAEEVLTINDPSPDHNYSSSSQETSDFGRD